MEKRINKINDELKSYINESKFISNKCRNKVIKLLGEEFNINIDKDKYVEFANVDVRIDLDGNIIVRGNSFNTNINNIDEIESRFNNFKEKADIFLKKKEINFENKTLFNNIVNLIVVILILFIFLGISIISIKSILSGDFYFSIWFLVFVFIYIIPGLKDNLFKRIEQAKIFIKIYLNKRK